MVLQKKTSLLSNSLTFQTINFTLPKGNSKIHKKATLVLIPQAFIFTAHGKDNFIGKSIHTSMIQIENITDAKLGYAYANDICSLFSFISNHNILCDDNRYGICENSFYKIPIQFSEVSLNYYSSTEIQDFFKKS